MEKAKLAALQSKIELYNCIIAKHAKQKSKSQSAVVSHASSTIGAKTLSNAYGKVPLQTNSKITQSNAVNQPINLKFLNRNSSTCVPYDTFNKRTVIFNKSPISVVNKKKVPVKPFVKKSALSWSSTHKYINDNKKDAGLCKKTNVCIGNSVNFSKLPNLQDQRSTLKNNIAVSCLSAKLEGSSKCIVKNAQNLQPIAKTPLRKEILKSHPGSFCDEIKAMIEQLKHANKTLSSKNLGNSKASNNLNTNVKLSSKFVSSSNLAAGEVAKNIVSRVLSPKSSSSATVPKLSTSKLETTLHKKSDFNVACTLNTAKTINSSLSCIGNNSKLISLQSMISKQNKEKMNIVGSRLLERKLESRPETCIKPIKKLEKVQKTAPPKTPVSVKRKVVDTKVIPSRSIMSYQHSLSLRASAVQENFKTVFESHLNKSQLAHQNKLDLKPCKTKTKLINSKYKVVNKNYATGNLKGNSLEPALLKSLKSPMPIFSSKRKPFSQEVPKSKKKIVDRSTFFKAYSMPSIDRFSNKLCLNTSTKKTFKQNSPLKRPKIHSLNSKSKFKVINKSPRKSCTKVSKGLKSGSNKLLNFTTDVDLLMELAAEKNSLNNSTTTHQDRSVLLKRLYKSKNTIINKNVSSAQVKTAKMIKSKYFATNKRYLGHKQAKSRNFSNFKNFPGGHKNLHAKYHSASFYNRRIKRNHCKHKFSSYANTSYFSRNVKKIQYPQNKLAFGTRKSFKRISGNRAVFSKTYVKKTYSPISKSLASRVLQHSINRVLIASVKKKLSKVNTYCMFYNRFGRCNKGTKCTYIHDPSKITICTRFLRGTCKDKNCLFSHEICPGKMAICSFFLSGSCTKINCPYRHEMLSPGAELCKAFVKGYCPDGKQCKKAHVLVCPDYVKGFCSKGDACAFPHPPPKEKKIISERPAEKCENVDKDSDDILMERVSRYFQPSNEETSCNSVVPKRKNLPEQPSFISLSIDDCDS